MNKSLLDTDILSEIGKGIDPTVARHAAAYLSAFGRYTLSAVTVAEVIWGLEKRQSVRRLHAFRASLPSMEVLPFADAADLAGRIGAGLDRIGQPIGLADTMIAAIALEHGLGGGALEVRTLLLVITEAGLTSKLLEVLTGVGW